MVPRIKIAKTPDTIHFSTSAVIDDKSNPLQTHLYVNRRFREICVTLFLRECLKARYNRAFQTILHDFTRISAQCPNQAIAPLQILEWFVRRWQIEVTFQEVRAHLGVETRAAMG